MCIRDRSYTVHATVEVDGQISRMVGGGAVIPLSDAPRLSLWFEPEVGPSEGYFNQIMQVRISVQDPDGIEWIRAKRNGDRYQAVANNSLQTFTEDGHQVLEVWARDMLGNETNPRTLEFYIDRTRPIISISGALERGTVERGEAATADFGCDDATSGVASCTISWSGGSGGAEQPSGSAIDTTYAGTFAYTIVARDRAGNEMRRLGILTVDPGDITPPTVDHEVVPQPGATGWHRSEAEVILDAHDEDSGLASLQYRVDNGAVSYTHLDVYKRQPLERIRGVATSLRPRVSVIRPASSRSCGCPGLVLAPAPDSIVSRSASRVDSGHQYLPFRDSSERSWMTERSEPRVSADSERDSLHEKETT